MLFVSNIQRLEVIEYLRIREQKVVDSVTIDFQEQQCGFKGTTLYVKNVMPLDTQMAKQGS